MPRLSPLAQKARARAEVRRRRRLALLASRAAFPGSPRLRYPRRRSAVARLAASRAWQRQFCGFGMGPVPRVRIEPVPMGRSWGLAFFPYLSGAGRAK